MMSTNPLQTSARALLALLMLFALACDPSDPCDPGDYEEHGQCRALPEPAVDAGGDASSGDDDDGGSEAEPPADPYAGFGDECAEASNCPSGLICGAPMLPMCTQVNCMDDESVCPPGWTCLDLTGLSPDPNVSSICLE
jgi:hypothetical protein